MSEQEKVYEKAIDLSFPEKLKAIPIAKKGMRPEDLRCICLDYMRLQISFLWLPDEDYDYIVDSQNYPVHLAKGTLHGGLPYVTIGTGNLYRALEYYDPETGILNTKELGKDKKIFGNACSGAASSAWSRAISSAKMGFTQHMTQHNGYINVGPYKYSKDLEVFLKYKKQPEKAHLRYTPEHICKENGEQVMYESYALVQPADGLVSPGHVRMISSVATVFRNADGTIDGDRSFMIYCDQVCYENAYHHVRFDDDKDIYRIHGGLDVMVSFSELYKTFYIPFTFKEFLGEAEVQDAKVDITLPKGSFSVDDLKRAEITSNYLISDLFISVKNAEGKEVYSDVVRLTSTTPEELDVYKLSFGDRTQLDALRGFEDGKNTFTLSAQLLNGEKPTVCTGILAKA